MVLVTSFHIGKPCRYHESNNPNWAPSLSLGYSSGCCSSASKRYLRLKSRRQRKKGFSKVHDSAANDASADINDGGGSGVDSDDDNQ